MLPLSCSCSPLLRVAIRVFRLSSCASLCTQVCAARLVRRVDAFSSRPLGVPVLGFNLFVSSLFIRAHDCRLRVSLRSHGAWIAPRVGCRGKSIYWCSTLHGVVEPASRRAAVGRKATRRQTAAAVLHSHPTRYLRALCGTRTSATDIGEPRLILIDSLITEPSYNIVRTGRNEGTYDAESTA